MKDIFHAMPTRHIAIDALLEKNFKHKEVKDVLLASTNELDAKHRELREVKKILMAILKSNNGEIWINKTDYENVSFNDAFEINDDDVSRIKIRAVGA